MRNVFVKHRNGITPVAALRGHLDWLANNYARPNELAIASGCFRPAIRGTFASRRARPIWTGMALRHAERGDHTISHGPGLFTVPEFCCALSHTNPKRQRG